MIIWIDDQTGEKHRDMLKEAYQILNILLKRTDKKGHANHPMVHMWGGYENALKQYTNTAIQHWIARGYNNNMKYEIIIGDIIMPPWIGFQPLHASHRSKLLQKDKNHYSEFNWTDNQELPYVWFDTNESAYYEQLPKERKYLIK